MNAKMQSQNRPPSQVSHVESAVSSLSSRSHSPNLVYDIVVAPKALGRRQNDPNDHSLSPDSPTRLRKIVVKKGLKRMDSNVRPKSNKQSTGSFRWRRKGSTKSIREKSSQSSISEKIEGLSLISEKGESQCSNKKKFYAMRKSASYTESREPSSREISNARQHEGIEIQSSKASRWSSPSSPPLLPKPNRPQRNDPEVADNMREFFDMRNEEELGKSPGSPQSKHLRKKHHARRSRHERPRPPFEYVYIDKYEDEKCSSLSSNSSYLGLNQTVEGMEANEVHSTRDAVGTNLYCCTPIPELPYDNEEGNDDYNNPNINMINSKEPDKIIHDEGSIESFHWSDDNRNIFTDCACDTFYDPLDHSLEVKDVQAIINENDGFSEHTNFSWLKQD